MPASRGIGPTPLPYFFFGTLMDLGLLARVTACAIDTRQVEPATISGFRRTGVIGRAYPILVRSSSSRVGGIIVRGLGPSAARRLAKYEGRNYRLTPVTVMDRTGTTRSVSVFLVVGGLRTNRRHWRLDLWQRRWKRRAMRRAGRLKDPPLRA